MLGDFTGERRSGIDAKHDFFVLKVDDFPDEVRFFVHHLPEPELRHGIRIVFSPTRTPVGVALATAAALAAAVSGQGELLDYDVNFVLPHITDPGRFIAAMKLTSESPDFSQACLQWVRHSAGRLELCAYLPGHLLPTSATQKRRLPEHPLCR